MRSFKINFSCIFVLLIFVCVREVTPRPKSKWERENVFEWKDKSRVCGYEGCPVPKPDMINVHLIPHTHDDVGWLKTLDQYYFGSSSNIQKAGVQYILDSIVQELSVNPNRRFSFVESAFFFKWWAKQSNEIREQVKQFVQEGRLEFVGGAWVMNDEATVNYQSIIDQFTFGLKKLNDTFGECGRPKIAWQLDPFGHSRELASLSAQMNYDGLFFSRMDYADREYRLQNKLAEVIWEGSPNLGKQADIFSGLLKNHYSPPRGFCFDYLCNDEPIIDGKSPDNNVKSKVDDFALYVNSLQNDYRSNNVIITMGDDFHYQSAGMWYKNLDKLIKYTNARQKDGSNINAFYSSPSCYVKAVHDSNITWPTKNDDYFPYASDPHAFWTGYFTSRPNKKRFERMGNNFLQVCKQLSALAPDTIDFFNLEFDMEPLKAAMGVLQHHDALTGTEKQLVNNDYNRMLYEGFKFCESNTEVVLNELTNFKSKVENNDAKTKASHVFEFQSCLNLNISQCDVSENSDNFIVTIYNPRAHETVEHVRIPIPDGTYSVRDADGNEITHQFVPIPDPVKALHFRHSKAINELVFSATNLPPLGYRSYYISKTNIIPVQINVERPRKKKDGKSNEEVTIGNAFIYATFGENGLLSRVSANGAAENLTQTFYYYNGVSGNNAISQNRSSGAYIFRPDGTEWIIADSADIAMYQGPVVDEIHQVFSEWVSQVIRIYKDENYIEFEWLVGPIPIEDNVGKEIISRFTTNIQSNGVFETDANGREVIKRTRNRREWNNYPLLEPVAGNYYPVTSKISIEDGHARMTVLNDRSQGGSSLSDGSLELMVHRRLLHDDAFGVGEALNELAYGEGIVARGHHYLLFGSSHLETQSLKAQERLIQNRKLLQGWMFFSNAEDIDLETWEDNFENSYAGLTQSLPINVNLLTLEPWNNGSVLLRLEHLLEKGEDIILSEPVTVDVQQIFRTLKISNMRETTLAANQWLDEATRFEFRKDESKQSKVRKPKNAPTVFDSTPFNDEFSITLEPMQIRTFIVNLEA